MPVAADGTGRNGIFTKHLLEAIKTPGLEIGLLLRKVRSNVQKETGGAQTPFELSSLVGQYYFSGGAAETGAVANPPAVAQPSYRVDAEEELWLAVKESDKIAELETYLKKYRDGRFAEVASLKISRLRGAAETSSQKNEPTAPKTGEPYTDPITDMEFIFVPGGCFQMGDTFGDGYAGEKPVHEVCVDGFYMGKYEVTQGEYQAITGSNPSGSSNGSRYPVEKVSWDDAQSFIRSLNNKSGKNFRLPTEAEWEYAARSGGKAEKYSGSSSPDGVAWYSENSGKATHQVGTKSANGLGLFDMSGNVWEWCSDWYGEKYYGSSPRQNPTGPSSGGLRVVRGGSWYYFPRSVRSASRSRDSPVNHSSLLGFRLVLQASAPARRREIYFSAAEKRERRRNRRQSFSIFILLIRTNNCYFIHHGKPISPDHPAKNR